MKKILIAVVCAVSLSACGTSAKNENFKQQWYTVQDPATDTWFRCLDMRSSPWCYQTEGEQK